MALTDNFESYSNGNLTGQGTWSGDTHAQVQTAVVNTGSKAIKFEDGTGALTDTITATFTAVSGINRQGFYFRLDTNGTNHLIGVRLMGDTNSVTLGTIDLVRTSSTQCKVRFNNGPNNDIVTGLTLGTWVKIVAEVNTTTDHVKIYVNDNAGTDYASETAVTTFDAIVVRIDNDTGGTVTAYFDDFFLDRTIKKVAGISWS